jgi:N4-(beta-N-acetylglucosaminyl)-L-asparaginase
MMACGAFSIVQNMRRGMSPTDACLETLRRVVALSERRLLDATGRPKFDLSYYALNKRGEFGAANFYPGARFAVHDGQEARLADSAYLFTERPHN